MAKGYRHRIVFVDDEPYVLGALEKVARRTFADLDVELITFVDPCEALAYIEKYHAEISVVVTDYSMPDLTGSELIRRIYRLDREIACVVITGVPDDEIGRAGQEANIFEFILKGGPTTEVINAVSSAHTYVLHKQVVRYKLERAMAQGTQQRLAVGRMADAFPEEEEGVDSFHGIVGVGSSFERLRQTILKVADSVAPCFIQGESGTGKELVARALHEESSRARRGNFVAVNCGALPAELVESELFGYKKGAFTGAASDKMGLIEQAHGGTLFLDEVTEMPLATQVKLLRFLQEGTIQRLGDVKPRRVDVRVVAATNRDPVTLIREGKFRQDLYYRLNVVPIHLLPLRERREQILPLARYFLAIYARAEGKEGLRMSPEMERFLLRYEWPGNIRELRNVIHRMVLFAEGEVLGWEDFPPELRRQASLPFPDAEQWEQAPSSGRRREPIKPRLLADDRSTVEWALEVCGNDKTAAARLLGISRATLYRRLKKYHLR